MTDTPIVVYATPSLRYLIQEGRKTNGSMEIPKYDWIDLEANNNRQVAVARCQVLQSRYSSNLYRVLDTQPGLRNKKNSKLEDKEFNNE